MQKNTAGARGLGLIGGNTMLARKKPRISNKVWVQVKISMRKLKRGKKMPSIICSMILFLECTCQWQVHSNGYAAEFARDSKHLPSFKVRKIEGLEANR